MLATNLQEVEKNIQKACEKANRSRDEITLIAVSKTKPVSMLKEVYDLGVRDFGENRADDLIQKAEALPKDINWHFIGHLQRNKVAKVLPYVSLIHSVESKDLLKVLNKEAQKLNRTIDVLIQFNLAEESTKTGLSEQEAFDFAGEALSYSHLNVKGIMTMGPHTEDEQAIEEVFRQAHELQMKLKLQ